jgi:hypothetical protein
MNNIKQHLRMFAMLAVFGSLTSMSTLEAQIDERMMGQEGKGSDNIEPLFIKAKKDALAILEKIKLEEIDKLHVNESSKTWLKDSGHLGKLQFYIRKIEFTFQEGPCNEENHPRGTSYDNADPLNPKMCISYAYNRATTPEQAQALVIHEAGHFVGEKDHLFLSNLGVELVMQSNRKTKYFSAWSEFGSPEGTCAYWNVSFEKNLETYAKSAEQKALKQCRDAEYPNCVTVFVGPLDTKCGDVPCCAGYASAKGFFE